MFPNAEAPVLHSDVLDWWMILPTPASPHDRRVAVFIALRPKAKSQSTMPSTYRGTEKN
jgi:hypothetical protein